MKTYILSVSLLSFLALGVITSYKIFEKTTYFNSSDSIIIRPDIEVYSKESTAIVVGTVKEIVDHPNGTNIPYTRPMLDAQVEVSEVLKGDKSMTSLNVLMMGPPNGSVGTDEWLILNKGEKLLLFLGTNNYGDYVVAGGYAGKCIIDENGNVTGEPVFSMPLDELKSKIHQALNS